MADRLKMDEHLFPAWKVLKLRKDSLLPVLVSILNKEEYPILEKKGDFILLMTEKERRDYANSRNGNEMLNELMALISQIRNYEVVILIGSDKRLRLMEGMMDSQVISIVIGSSPITEDKWVDPEELRKILRMLKDAR